MLDGIKLLCELEVYFGFVSKWELLISQQLLKTIGEMMTTIS